MLHENKLRQLLDTGKPTLSTRLYSTSPLITEAVSLLGNYDYLEFAGEYAPFDQYGLENMVRAAEVHNTATVIKLDFQCRSYWAQKAIASGFHGVLFTDITTPEQVAESIRMVTPMCPQQEGMMGYAARRWTGYQSFASQDEYIDAVSKTVKIFMVEKKAAVDNVDEFLSVPGIDMVQFGPNDYALSSGFNASEHRQMVRKAEKKVIMACHDHHTRYCAVLNSAAEAEYYLDLGVRDFSLGLEIRILQNFLNQEGDALLNTLARNGVL